MLASARGRAWRSVGVCGSVPVYGRNVGRAISPAALRLAAPQAFRDDASTAARRRRFGAQSTKCRLLARRSPPAEHRARPCPASQDTSAARRQCTPPSAPCGASTSPCRGGFGGLPPYKASPVRGGVAPGDGGVRHPCPASILPGCRLSLPPRTRVGQCPLRRLRCSNHRSKVSLDAMRPPAFYPSRASSRTQMLRSSGGCAAGKQHRR